MQDYPEELLCKYVADNVAPTNLHYAYVAPYYVTPSVTAGERVAIRYYVTDWDQSEVQKGTFDRRFDVTVRCVDAAGETVEKTAKDVPAGDSEIFFDGLAAGNWNYALSAVDLTNGLPSHVVWGAFRVVAPGALDITDDETYKMTSADLATYGLSNDGDYERVVLVPAPDETYYRTGTQAIEEPGSALIDTYLAANPHVDDPVRPGYAVYVPSIDGTNPCIGACRVVRVIRDEGYDTNAVEQASRQNVLGLQRLLDEKAAAGFRKVVMLPGIYRLTATNTLNMVDGLTLDLNGATLKQNGFTGAHSLMIDFPAVTNAALVNGTIEGDYFEHDYAGSTDKSEWPMGFQFSSISAYCSVSNVIVKNITGYGGGCTYTCAGPGNWLSHADERTTNKYGMNYTYLNEDTTGWTKGGLRADGTLDPDAEGLYTCDHVSLYRYENFGWLQLSRKLGRGWIGTRGWNFIFGYYDEGGACVGTEIVSHYRLTKIPAGAKTVRVSVEIGDTSELADGMLMIAYMKIPVNCAIEDCTFDHCRAVGFAMGPCRNFILRNNLFTRSGEILAKCAFDAEDGGDYAQDIYFLGNTFRDNPNNELLTCRGINFVFERNSTSFDFYSRTYGYCVRSNDVRGATFGCGERTRTGYCRIRDNTYRYGKLLLGGKGQHPSDWSVVIEGEDFSSEKNGATFAAASSGTGLFRNCTFNDVGNAVGNAEFCSFTNPRSVYCGNGWHGTWTGCTASGGASAQQYSTLVFLNCNLTDYAVGCSRGSQTMIGCKLTDMKLNAGVKNCFTGTVVRCELKGTTTVPSSWTVIE